MVPSLYIYLINARIVDNITSLGLHQFTDVTQTDSFDQNLPADMV